MEMGLALTAWAPPVQAEKARPAAVQEETPVELLAPPVAAGAVKTAVGQ